MKRKKSNLIMNIALICALTIIATLPLPVAEAANLGISKTNVTLEAGKSTTITISATTHTGRIDIISSNTNVATASESTLWVENNSKTITISAKTAGTAKITVKGELFDADTEEEKEFSQTINVTVKASSSNSNSAGSNSSGSNSGNTIGGTSGNTGGSVNGNTSGNTGGTQSGSSSSGSSANQNSGSATTSSSSSSSASSNSSTNSSKPTQNNTSVSDSSEAATIIEENLEEMINEIEIEETNVTEEVSQEEAKIEEDLKEETLNNIEINTTESATSVNSKGKILLIAVIGTIALAMIFIGIGVSKNILKK